HRVELTTQLIDRHGVREIALVPLQHDRQLVRIVAVVRQVLVEVLERGDVRVHALRLRVGDEDETVDTLQDQATRGVVVDLPGYGVEVEARLEAADGTEIDGQEVEEERALLLGRERDELAA